MKTLRIFVHGFALLLANLIGVYVGFMVYYYLRPANQIAIQAPVATIVSIALYLCWTLLLGVGALNRMRLRGLSEFGYSFVCALVWNPIIFVPLHYFTQGYVTAVGNVIALLMFQIPVNVLAILLAMRAMRLSGEGDFAAASASQNR